MEEKESEQLFKQTPLLAIARSVRQFLPGSSTWQVTDPLFESSIDLGFETFVAHRYAQLDRLSQALHIAALYLLRPLFSRSARLLFRE